MVRLGTQRHSNERYPENIGKMRHTRHRTNNPETQARNVRA